MLTTIKIPKFFASVPWCFVSEFDLNPPEAADVGIVFLKKILSCLLNTTDKQIKH